MFCCTEDGLITLFRVDCMDGEIRRKDSKGKFAKEPTAEERRIHTAHAKNKYLEARMQKLGRGMEGVAGRYPTSSASCSADGSDFRRRMITSRSPSPSSVWSPSFGVSSWNDKVLTETMNFTQDLVFGMTEREVTGRLEVYIDGSFCAEEERKRFKTDLGAKVTGVQKVTTQVREQLERLEGFANKEHNAMQRCLEGTEWKEHFRNAEDQSTQRTLNALGQQATDAARMNDEKDCKIYVLETELANARSV